MAGRWGVLRAGKSGFAEWFGSDGAYYKGTITRLPPFPLFTASLLLFLPPPSQVGGAYYKGTITHIGTAENWTGPGEFDPWESINVHWDNEENSVTKVWGRGWPACCLLTPAAAVV